MWAERDVRTNWTDDTGDTAAASEAMPPRLSPAERAHESWASSGLEFSDYLAGVVAAFPPITAEQRNRLSVLIAGGGI